MEDSNLKGFFMPYGNFDHEQVRAQTIQMDSLLLQQSAGEPLIRPAVPGESYPRPYTSMQVVVSLFAIMDPGREPVVGHLRMFYPHIPGPLEGTKVDLPKDAVELDETSNESIQALIRHTDQEINRIVASHHFSAN